MDLVDLHDLAKVLEAEIKSKQLYLQKRMPADFAFIIHDKDDPRDQTELEMTKMFRDHFQYERENSIILAREFEGEKILAMVDMPYSFGNNYGLRNKSGAGDAPPPLKLVVKISKRNGKKLSLNISASADDLTIESMWVNVPTDDDYCDHQHPEDYTVNKDSNWQHGLREYLKQKGIDKSCTDFVYKYMERKSKRQPMLVLKNLHNVVKN